MRARARGSEFLSYDHIWASAYLRRLRGILFFCLLCFSFTQWGQCKRFSGSTYIHNFISSSFFVIVVRKAFSELIKDPMPDTSKHYAAFLVIGYTFKCFVSVGITWITNIKTVRVGSLRRQKHNCRPVASAVWCLRWLRWSARHTRSEKRFAVTPYLVSSLSSSL